MAMASQPNDTVQGGDHSLTRWERTVDVWAICLTHFFGMLNSEVLTPGEMEVFENSGRLPCDLDPLQNPLQKVLVLGLRLALLFSPLILITIPVLLWPIALEQTWTYMKEYMASSPLSRSIGLALLVIVACLLYWAKTAIQAVYGGAEFFVGLLSCWIGLSEPKSNDLATSIAIIGGVYILIRGCENILTGIKPFLANPLFPRHPFLRP